MEGWVEDIIENTHYKDIKTLHFKLDEAIESHEKRSSPARIEYLTFLIY